MESKIPQANRRPKFRLEEVSPLDLIKICGGFVVAFVLVSTVWILTAEEMDNPRKTWLLKPCHSDGNDFENETSLDIFSLAGRCIIASPSTPFESDEALPLRLGLDFTTYGGALYQTHVQFSAIGIGTQDLLYDGQVTKVQGEPAENTGTTFGMGCGPGATADTASHCYLDQDVIYEDRRPLQLDWSVSFTVINAPPLLFNMTQSVGVFSVTTNRGFEYQELIVRYLLLVVAGIVAAVFYYQIGYSRLNYPWHAWAHEQKWTFVLLVLLIGFDNPFIFLKLGDTSETSQKGMWLFVDVCFRYTFLIGYFFAVLSMTDHMAQVCCGWSRSTPSTTPLRRRRRRHRQSSTARRSCSSCRAGYADSPLPHTAHHPATVPPGLQCPAAKVQAHWRGHHQHTSCDCAGRHHCSVLVLALLPHRDDGAQSGKHCRDEREHQLALQDSVVAERGDDCRVQRCPLPRQCVGLHRDRVHPGIRGVQLLRLLLGCDVRTGLHIDAPQTTCQHAPGGCRSRHQRRIRSG